MSEALKLTGTQRKILREGIIGAYPNPDDLKILLSEQMDVQLGAIARGNAHNAKVFALIQDFEAEGRIEEFIRVVVADKPKSPYLESIKNEFAGISAPKAQDPHNKNIDPNLDNQERLISQVELGFRYDAYISYVDIDTDANWVWDTLVPRLKDAGLKIAISGDVEEPGVERVVNVETGMRQAKRTIIVLSEAYLNNTMAKFENTLGQTMGIQEGNYRLLPVKFMAVDINRLPTRLSMLTTLDLSHPRRAEREFQRLVQALQSPLPKMEQ
jgi:hypothetical protein